MSPSTPTTDTTQLPIEQLTTEQLDYCMYQHACKALGNQPTDNAFKAGYQSGQFHFSSDREILADLMNQYDINLQQLGGEWLASNTEASIYGKTPTEAACRLVVKLSFGTHASITDTA